MLLCVLVPAAQALRSLLRRWRARPLTMRSECDVLVKFGGSAVTVKASFEKLNEASLASAAAAVASGGRKAVLIHGAGSFGHFQARKHSVSKGTAAPGFSWRGFGLTRASVCKLNGHVVNALLEAGVAAVGMPPFPTWVTRGKGVVAPAATSAGLDRVRAALAAGLTPVLHGDAVLDELQGCSILSGDTLMVLLARELSPNLAVFLTDVAGVYDSPPSQAGATLLRRIRVSPDGQMSFESGNGSTVETSTAAHDVTGGLEAKLEAAAQIARAGTPVVIVEAGTSHAEAALRGEVPEVCTLMTCEEGTAPAPAPPLEVSPDVDLVETLGLGAAVSKGAGEALITIAGYASLVDEVSARETTPALRRFRYGHVQGYCRVFTLVSIVNIRRGLASGSRLATATARPCADASLRVCLYEIPISELPALLERERRLRISCVNYVETRDSDDVGSALLFTEYSDGEYWRERCGSDAAVYESEVGRFYPGGLPIYRDDLLPVPQYVLRCVRAHALAGPAALANLLDQSFLGDGKTSLREHLRKELAQPASCPWADDEGEVLRAAIEDRLTSVNGRLIAL